MITLNLPLEVYIYILYILIAIMVYACYYFFTDTNINKYSQIILVWTLILFILNFANMIMTLNNYLSNSTKVGNKGPRGEIGPRGFKGQNSICSQCDSEKKESVYAGNVNDNGDTVNKTTVKMGECKFPFVFNNEFKYSCITEPRQSGEPNDASVNGWCATELNSDMTYKTYGYCKDSIANKKNIKDNNDRQNREQSYYKTNYGLIDLQVITGTRSNIKCETGYIREDKDLNTGADGNYVYLCKKIGLDDIGIQNIKMITGNDTKCPSGFRKIDANLNDEVPELTDKDSIHMCVKKGNKDFIKELSISNTKKCPKDYKTVGINMNLKTNGDPLYLCATNKQQSIIIDTGFVWGKNNSIYLFEKDQFWKVKDTLDVEKSSPIESFWGKNINNIDALFTNPSDSETYLFKGSQFYKYDYEKENVSPGYPKYIKNVWKGVPDNLDAIYASKDKKVYFIKGKYYYTWDSKKKEASTAKQLDKKWEGCPSNINAMFYYPKTDKTYIIQSYNVYTVNNRKVDVKNPIPINKMFKGL